MYWIIVNEGDVIHQVFESDCALGSVASLNIIASFIKKHGDSIRVFKNFPLKFRIEVTAE
jgi:hypothetical protein